jgi:hypothetical protein
MSESGPDRRNGVLEYIGVLGIKPSTELIHHSITPIAFVEG